MIRSIPLHVQRRWSIWWNEHWCQTDVVIVACVLGLASTQQTAFSSQKPWYEAVFHFFFFFFLKVLCVLSRFWNGAVEDRLFSCIICLLPKRRGSAGRVRPLLHIYGIVFLSSEAIQTVGEQQEVPALRCWTDLLILKRACVYECLFSVTGRMCSAHCCHTKTLAITSSLLSLLDCHDVNDGNSATILRLCSFSLFFFCRLGQGVVYPVYVNCCHIKKSHINSKRHNKLIFVKLLDLCNFISSLFLRTNGTCFGTSGRISGSRR